MKPVTNAGRVRPDSAQRSIAEAYGATKPRLRFDRVAQRFVSGLNAALGAVVPQGHTLVFGCTAPIRLAGKTAGEIEERLKPLLAGRKRMPPFDAAIHGNRIRARLIQSSPDAPASVGFVYNDDADPEELFAAARTILSA